MKIYITEEEAYTMVDELKEIKRKACKLLKSIEESSEMDFRGRRHEEDDDDDDDMHFRRGRGRY